MLDWLIVGGGIHGTHLAHVFVQQCGLAPAAVRVLDPHERLLAAWTQRTNNTGMRYLRSPRVHNIDIDAHALERFAQYQPADGSEFWIAPYNRPSYALFQQHCQHVVETYQLEDLHIRGQALALHRVAGGWCVETATERLTARRVLLATGRQQPFIPDWAQRLIAEQAPVQHVLDMAFDTQQMVAGATVMVLGGGISAGQVALKLMDQHAVTLVTRQPLRHRDFDSSPCWLGPACLKSFGNADHARRRWMIGEARQPGTLARDIYKDLNKALRAQALSHRQERIVAAQTTADNRIALEFADGTLATVDHLVLATGLKAVPPAQSWLADAMQRYQLRVAECGYPILDRKLCWADGLYASGPLAELELGPASANIAGARAAAERLQRVKYVN